MRHRIAVLRKWLTDNVTALFKLLDRRSKHARSPNRQGSLRAERGKAVTATSSRLPPVVEDQESSYAQVSELPRPAPAPSSAAPETEIAPPPSSATRRSPSPESEAVSSTEASTETLASKAMLPAPATLASALTAAILAERKWSIDVARCVDMCALRFGFDGHSRTLEEIGERYGLTRERVRQIVERSLKRIERSPFVSALRASVTSVLDERDCVTVDELARLSPWFGSIDARGLKLLLDAFCAKWVSNSLIMAVPSGDVELATRTMFERLDRLRNVDAAITAVDQLAIEAALVVERPRLALTLAGLARQRLTLRRRTFADFVREYVERSDRPVRLAELHEAGKRSDFTVSVGQARNALSGCEGMFPLGASTYGTFTQIFPEPWSDLNIVARRAEQLVCAKPDRQFHADELLDDARRMVPHAAALVGDGHRLAALLRTRTTLRYLGRSIFSSDAHEARLELVALARRVLQDAGSPLQFSTLIAEMRKHRGVSRYSIQAVLAQLVQVRRGVFGLPGRDDAPPEARPTEVSSDEIALAILIEDAFAALRPGEVVATAELRGRLFERGSEEANDIDAARLRAILAKDYRFRVSSRGLIALSECRFDEQAAS